MRTRSARRIAAAVALSAAALATSAAAASANVYCVNVAGGDCTDTPADFGAALSDANNNPGLDTVRLGPGTYSTLAPGGFVYQGGAGNPVEIDGAGVDQTEIAVQPPNMAPAAMTQFKGLTIDSGSTGSIVSDLSIELPTPVFVDILNPFGLNQEYVALRDGGNSLIKRISIGSPGQPPMYGSGIISDGAETQIQDSSIVLGWGDGNYPSYALSSTASTNGDLEVSDSRLESSQTVRYSNQGSGGKLIVDRSTLRATNKGVYAEDGDVSLSNSVIELGASANAIGLDASFSNTNSALSSIVDIDGSTIVGSGANQRGVYAAAYDNNNAGVDPDIADIDVRNTVIDLRGANPIAVERYDDADGTADVRIDHSSLDASTNVSTSVAPMNPGAITLGAGNLTGPQPPSDFVAFPTDLHLAAGSSLLDAGDPAAPAAGTLDRDGNPRAVDATPACNGNVDRRDIGAYEFVPAPPSCNPPDGGSGGPGATPGVTPPVTLPATRKKCRKGQKLKKIKGKRKCVRKKRKR